MLDFILSWKARLDHDFMNTDTSNALILLCLLGVAGYTVFAMAGFIIAIIEQG